MSEDITASTFIKVKKSPERWEETLTKRFKFVLASHKELSSMPPRHYLFVLKNGDTSPFCSYNYEVSIMTGNSFLTVSKGNFRQNLGETEDGMSLKKFKDIAFNWASNEFNLIYDKDGECLFEPETNQDTSEAKSSLIVIVIGILFVLFLLNTDGPLWLIAIAVGAIFYNVFSLITKRSPKKGDEKIEECDDSEIKCKTEVEKREPGMENEMKIESIPGETPEKKAGTENQAAIIADADSFDESGDIIPGPGHVFMMPLENGLYGACRVIRKGDPSKRKTNNLFDPREEGYLVMATTWVGSDLPDLSDPRLRKPLMKTFSEWNNEPEFIWTDHPLPDNFKHVGTIIPTQAELEIDCQEKVGWTWLPSMVLKQYEWDQEEHPKMIEEDGLTFDLGEYKDESLWYAAESGKINVLKAAIKAGANPNTHNGTNTALMAAARYGHSEAARLLIEAGANPNIKNSGGDTALSWAENGSEVASLLEGITDQSKTISILQFPIMKQQD